MHSTRQGAGNINDEVQSGCLTEGSSEVRQANKQAGIRWNRSSSKSHLFTEGNRINARELVYNAAIWQGRGNDVGLKYTENKTGATK